MKTNLTQIIGFLLLGCAAIVVNAAPPPGVLSTPLVYAGPTQASGRCSLFNAESTSFTLVTLQAEDGQGNVLASTDAANCANKSLAGHRSCTMTFAISPANDSVVCWAKVTPPKITATTTPTALHTLPSPVLGAEVLDSTGNVLVQVNGVMVTPPPPPSEASLVPPPLLPLP
jgi:hypothetical protein